MPGTGLPKTVARQAIALTDEVDLATWATLQGALDELVRGAFPQPVLDLSAVAFIDVHGAGLIVQAARRLGPGRVLVLRGAPPVMRRIADVLGLDRQPGLVIERQGDDGD